MDVQDLLKVFWVGEDFEQRDDDKRQTAAEFHCNERTMTVWSFKPGRVRGGFSRRLSVIG